MSSDILGFDELSASQSGKYITHNEALRQLEGMLVRVLDRNPGGVPGAPNDGDTYIVDTVGAGLWSTSATGDIAYYYGSSWHFYTPSTGVRLFVNDEEVIYIFNGTDWEYSTPLTNLKTRVATATVTMVVAGTVTLQVNIPSGAKIIGCQLRVDDGMVESWDAEWNDGASLQAIVSAAATPQNTKVNKFHDDSANTPLTDAETDIVLAPNAGGNFSAIGTISAIAYYQTLSTMVDV